MRQETGETSGLTLNIAAPVLHFMDAIHSTTLAAMGCGEKVHRTPFHSQPSHNLYGKMLNPRQINNQLSETANHWMSLTFDLAHALIGFTFAPRLYTRNVRLFVQFYICCIFTPSLSPSLTVQ